MSTPTIDDSLSIAEELLGDLPDRIEPFHPSVGGDDSHSFRLWAGQDEMLLKIKRDPYSPVGVYFHGRVKEAGVPVPELVSFDPDGGPNGEACVLWEWVERMPAEWQHPQPCPYDEAEFGELLRRIHDLRFDGPFGFLGDEPPALSSPCLPDCGPTSASWAPGSSPARCSSRANSV